MGLNLLTAWLEQHKLQVSALTCGHPLDRLHFLTYWSGTCIRVAAGHADQAFSRRVGFFGFCSKQASHVKTVGCRKKTSKRESKAYAWLLIFTSLECSFHRSLVRLKGSPFQPQRSTCQDVPQRGRSLGVPLSGVDREPVCCASEP